jgi:NitT/TauT family transport system permease protein
MRHPKFGRIWGEARALFDHTRRIRWVDLFVIVGLAGLLFGLIDVGREWSGEHRQSVEIDLSPWALPQYTFYSLSRGLFAYLISLTFTLIYGYWAAKDRNAERVLIPMLDILQSIPVLGFMPALIIALIVVFPNSNIGLELAAVIMIFTGQAWNMTFSFYHSLRSIPADMREAAAVFRFGWWQRFKWVELPYATTGLVWNSMMSMAGGWFFLMINESFRLGDRDFRLPGIGSYMSVAVEQGRVDSMLYAIFAMVVMILLVDQLLWRPVVVWAQKFRVEEVGRQDVMSSWFLNWLRRSALVRSLGNVIRRMRLKKVNRRATRSRAVRLNPSPLTPLPLILLLALLIYGGWKLFGLIEDVPFETWGDLVVSAFYTLGRVLASTAIGTLWALPAGLAIGLSPRLSRIFQPIVQVAASFPAPMLFPLVIAGLQIAGVSLGWGSILLMLLGTQWYILFNVIAGAMAVPADMREAAQSYRIRGWQRFRTLYLPAVFPYLVTGWVTAAGGAWNASIVAEFVTFKGEALQTRGLGSQISAAAAAANFALLAASILVMSTLVVVFNRLVWRQCYRLAEQRYSLTK